MIQVSRCVRRYLSHQRADRFNSLISQDIVVPSSPTSSVGGGGSGSAVRLLDGLRYACKDNIVTKNTTTTAASRSLFNYKSPFDATVVKLLSQQGATCVGKANLDEFGMGSANRNSFYGPVINPYNEKAISGGSSGGSAAAVAGSDPLCDFALGTDTGGSIRLPASYCNVFGFKPSYGRLSRWGIVPYAQTLDTVGVIARDVDTIRKVYRVTNVYDNKDPTSLPEDVRATIQTTQMPPENSTREKLTIGVPEQFIMEQVTPTVRQKWEDVLNKLLDLGHKLESISIKSIIKALPAYYTLATSEAASNLARYDGTRYGYTSKLVDIDGNDQTMKLMYDNRTQSFGEEVKRRIILGNFTLSSESADYYMRANKLRETLNKEVSSFFKNEHVLLKDGQQKQSNSNLCDLLISPTAMDVAPTIEDYVSHDKENILNGFVNDIFTVPASLAGLPSISIPYDGVGIQLMGQYGDDDFVLDVAELIKQ
ncbi:HER2 [Candida oxycetoniae]|uniref:Glutamyl-tRNA(Gln) amidotransferase subunit A, mitochondrial n=1 Tax=Candida oxycetoniae TaxID=497107 RepID=A0AAI9SXV8_9ASCO|nr:HER2 [Candida oxycetoniae]KAI3404751.2 HER2 [Candida oxycetoniae]